MIRRILLALLVAVAVLAGLAWALSRPATESLARPSTRPDASIEAQGAAAFVGSGFGGISMEALASNAVPWRLVAAALVLDEQSRDPTARADRSTLDRILARFGFLTRPQPANLPDGVNAVQTEMPLGFTYGDIAPVGGTVVRVANLGCAACHAGVTYAADGKPLPEAAVLGMPNSSLDLEAYTMAVFKALRRFANSPELVNTAQTLFPQMGWRERLSLRYLVLPLAKQRLTALADAARPLPFPNGAPGSTNGVAALKAAFGIPLAGGGPNDAGVVSIPDLGDRVWRTSLLADGAYVIPAISRDAPTTAPPDHKRLQELGAIMSFFTVPSMGVHPDTARGHLDDAAAVMAFLKGYRPQRFPGSVDPVRAAAGKDIYARDCSACHGAYNESLEGPGLTSFPNWQGDVGTDRLRADMFDAPLAAAVAKTSYRDTIAVRQGHGYVAPPLTGIWASAPYLHNGAVPTLAALLSPDERPARFQVGGHALDFDLVGIRLGADGAYPPGYQPFSVPAWIDTSSPGRGPGGHFFDATLTPAEKLQLLEYLKLL